MVCRRTIATKLLAEIRSARRAAGSDFVDEVVSARLRPNPKSETIVSKKPSRVFSRRAAVLGLVLSSATGAIGAEEGHRVSRLPRVSSTASEPRRPVVVPPTVEGLFESFSADRPAKPSADLSRPRVGSVRVNAAGVRSNQFATPPPSAIFGTTDRTPARPASASRSLGGNRGTAMSWLRSSTSAASMDVSRRLISQASDEYNVQAWASAESSAWEALRWACEGVELKAREEGNPSPLPALANLQVARTSIREARDFRTVGGAEPHQSIRRLALSHRTTVLDSRPLDRLTVTDAIDSYLDEARIRLAAIATESVEAAQAMDLLAAVYLGRADASTLPSSTALTLRRAALQGQPENASLAMRLGMHLADLGLNHEARWALEHSLSLERSADATAALAAVLRRTGEHSRADQLIASSRERGPAQPNANRPRVPQVTELTPAEFAAISKPVMTGSGSGRVPAQLASARTQTLQSNIVGDEVDAPLSGNAGESSEDKPGWLKRAWRSVVKPW